MTTLNRIKKPALWIFLAALVWCVTLSTVIWRYGEQDDSVKSDCIIILGAAVHGASPSPVFEERIRHGIHLYHEGMAQKMIFTGGFGDGMKNSESAVGRSVAMAQGVHEGDVLIEESSRTTQQNLSEARALMQKNGLRTAIIVSDPLHMKRAMMMADGIGMVAVSSPTPTSRYRSLGTRLGFLLRELYFFHHHCVTGN